MIESTDSPVSNDAERLAAVKRYQQFEWKNIESLDNLVKMVSRICNSPIAYISLIDDIKQTFLAQTGLHYSETKSSESFCQDTIGQHELVVIEDASQHPRYHDNPYVLGEPHIRFYAGMPISNSQGQNIGTLCVIDSKPRQLSFCQMESLKALKHHIIYLMESRMVLDTVEEQRRIILDSKTKIEEKYQAQNNQLRALAQVLSHQVSGPVASMKGLMYLIDTLPPDESKEYFPLMNLVLEQMDDAVRLVTENAFSAIE